ncbi:MAG: hypothetical protein ACI8SR_000319 [Oceanicoccus sp.]|jgi:hypothetical protein
MKNNRRQMAAKQRSRICSMTHSLCRMVPHVMNSDIPNSKLAIL